MSTVETPDQITQLRRLIDSCYDKLIFSIPVFGGLDMNLKTHDFQFDDTVKVVAHAYPSCLARRGSIILSMKCSTKSHTAILLEPRFTAESPLKQELCSKT